MRSLSGLAIANEDRSKEFGIVEIEVEGDDNLGSGIKDSLLPHVVLPGEHLMPLLVVLCL
jgi:hypothetical protein